MAARQVQEYLERHRIGALFEDLMAKVIKDTPEDPVGYLIKVLKKLYSEGSKGHGSSLPPSGSKVSFARSMGLSGSPATRHSFDEDRGVLAKSWAGADSRTDGSRQRPSSASKTMGRDYPRPWLSGSKPMRSVGTGDTRDNVRPPARTGQTQSDGERPPWDHRTALPSQDFDEWFNMQHRQTRTADQDVRAYQGTSSSWGRNGEMAVPAERTVIYNRRGGSSGPVKYIDDNLEDELNMGKDVKIKEEDNDSSSVTSYESSRSRKTKARHAAEEHRRQLQALLMNKSHSGGDINGMNDAEDHHDDGTELLENVDDLESEGVSGLNSKGSRLSKSIRQGTRTSESIRVSICARCAKVITGQASDKKSEVGSVYSGSEVDDNFESVSQVGSTIGRSRHVWPSGFDSESDASPRKGQQHIWQSPGRSPGRSPVKGKHMFRGGSFTTEQLDSSRPPSASSSRSDVVYSGRQQKSWNFDGYSSDNDTEVNFDRVGSPQLQGSRSWNRAPLESGSETDWDSRQKRRTPERRFARFNSGDESDST